MSERLIAENPPDFLPAFVRGVRTRAKSPRVFCTERASYGMRIVESSALALDSALATSASVCRLVGPKPNLLARSSECVASSSPRRCLRSRAPRRPHKTGAGPPPPTHRPLAPSPLASYEWRRLRVLMFGGGTRTNFAQFNDTWTWDGTNWTKLTPTTSPSGRSSHAMAYDFGRGRTVLFGGYTGTATLGDTWEFDGSNWIKRTPKTNPPARSGHKMVYDKRRRVVVMFAGTSPSRNDTWEWNGTDWKQVTTKNTPTPRCYHSAAFDEQRNEMLVFGGYSGGGLLDTWAYDGSDWRRVTTTGPGARYGHDMIYDPRRQRIVMTAGFGRGHTWEWDGYAWSQMSTATSPTTAGYSSLAYDLRRDKLVRFGGEPVINHTWVFDSGTTASYATYGKGCAGSNGTPDARRRNPAPRNRHSRRGHRSPTRASRAQRSLSSADRVPSGARSTCRSTWHRSAPRAAPCSPRSTCWPSPPPTHPAPQRSDCRSPRAAL